MSVPAAGSTPRLLALDLLRVAAVILVLGRHGFTTPEAAPSSVRWLFSAWQRGGWVGVDLFFVLSGFLVAGLLFTEFQKHGRLEIGRFYLRRGLKIYPAFYVLIFATIVIRLAQQQATSGRSIVAEVLFLQNYLGGIWNHTWSLAVEEHFYLALPLLLAYLLRRGRHSVDPFRHLTLLVPGIAVALLAARVLQYAARGFDPHASVFPTHLRIDSLLFGVLLAYGFYCHRDWFNATFAPHRRILCGAGITTLLLPFLFPLETTAWMPTLGLTLLYLGAGALLLGVLFTPLANGRLVRGIGFVGTHSYSIYLVHMAVLVWGMPLIDAHMGSMPYVGRAALYIGLCIGAGMVFARVVEYPVLRLRDRWIPSKAQVPVAKSAEQSAERVMTGVIKIPIEMA